MRRAFIILAIIASLAIPGAGVAKPPPTAKHKPHTVRCTAHAAVRFYAGRIDYWHRRMGAARSRDVSSRSGGCPLYLAHVLQRKAYAARIEFAHWRWTLAERRTWRDAVAEAQKAYPGTDGWLLSCSSSEGGWGRWVPNGDGSGAGGWLQFLSGTFWRMWGAARDDVSARGFRVHPHAASWYSPLGQALAGAWGVTHGRSHEWYGGGC